MLLWNKQCYRYLPNVIVALQPLKRNFSEFCGLFSYQALLRILILCLGNKQLIFFWNMFLKGPLGFFSMQNPHQKILNTGGLRLCRGAWHSKIWQKLSLFMVFHISIQWAWSFVWGAKSSRRNGTASMSSRNRVLKIVEYSPSCSSMEYCYSSFSLKQEFFISLGQNIVYLDALVDVPMAIWRNRHNKFVLVLGFSRQQVNHWTNTGKLCVFPFVNTSNCYVCNSLYRTLFVLRVYFSACPKTFCLYITFIRRKEAELFQM